MEERRYRGRKGFEVCEKGRESIKEQEGQEMIDPYSTEELWMHKDSDMMVRYYFFRDKKIERMKRILQFGLFCNKYKGTWIGPENTFIAATYGFFINSDVPALFPDDFIKIGDV